ncbi:MAG: dicarboxylate/amino acid:cation symporter [Rhodovibrionaceae bacterium]|nr:dicarboxylate/amino acid:cation symporter [Rhodovibrionaceae bacterium]
MATETSVEAEARRQSSRSLVHLTHHLNVLLRQHLWLRVLIGMGLGLVAGTLIGPDTGWLSETTSVRVASWIALPGNLFLATIKFIVLPLILASVIRGIAAEQDLATLQRLGLRVVLFFIVTTGIAIIIGCGLAFLIEPGAYVEAARVQSTYSGAPPPPSPKPAEGAGGFAVDIPGAILGVLPKNPFADLAAGNMLQVVVGAAVFGAALLMLPADKARPILDVMGSIQSACMVVVRWVMQFAPIAVFGLIAEITTRVGIGAIFGMAAYVATVVLGLLLLLGMYLLLIAVFARRSPLSFLRAAREVMLLAFSTSSSAAVMPLSLRTAEDALGVRPAITRFVIPLGTTINMAGTALYQGVAAIFLAQVFGIDVGWTGILLITLTAIGTSIGSPGTPGVGIVILATILASVGIPEAGIALIIGVDRLLDMARTTVNVTGDIATCVIMDRWLSMDAEAAPEPAPG